MTDRTSLPGFVLPWRQMKIVRQKLRVVDKMDQKKMERVQMVMTFIYFNRFNLSQTH